MDWYIFSIKRLREYEMRKQSLDNIKEQISILESQFTGLKAATADGTPTGDNENRREDMLIHNISKREELKNNYKLVFRDISITGNGLKALTEEERRILFVFFIERQKNYVERLCEELFISKTELYRRKDEALKKFTMACYGILEL